MDAGCQLKSEGAVHTAVFNFLANADDELSYLMYHTFDRLLLLILNCINNQEGKDYSELMQFVLEDDQLSQVLQNLPNSVVTVFTVIQLSPPLSSCY